MTGIFKPILGFAIGTVLVAGLMAWVMTTTPTRDALGEVRNLPGPPAPPPPSATEGEPAPGATPLKQAPAVELATVDGAKFSLASQRDRSPVVLFFFASWCPYCQKEWPQLIRLYEQYREKGLQAVAITREKPEELQTFLKTQQSPFPILLDETGKTSTAYQVEGIPVTYLVDRKGEVAHMIHGFTAETFWSEFAPKVMEQVK